MVSLNCYQNFVTNIGFIKCVFPDRHGIAVASGISAPAAINIIRRVRTKKGQPPVPESLEELGDLLETNSMLKEMAGPNYRGAVTPTDGGAGHGLIFADELMLIELNQGKMIEIDGTMKVQLLDERFFNSRMDGKILTNFISISFALIFLCFNSICLRDHIKKSNLFF